jgi:hypothetical protein
MEPAHVNRTNLPANVCIERFIPDAALLPHTVCVVGGIVTGGAGLRCRDIRSGGGRAVAGVVLGSPPASPWDEERP